MDLHALFDILTCMRESKRDEWERSSHAMQEISAREASKACSLSS